MNFIKLNVILNRIPRAIRRESNKEDLLSYALDALRFLNIHQRFKSEVKILKIKNFKTALPPDVKRLEAVSYMYGTPTEDELNEILCGTIGTCNSCSVNICEAGVYWDNEKAYCDSCSNCITEAEEYLSRTYNICRPSINYKLWMDSQLYKQNFALLHFTGNANGLLCTDCPNKQCHGCNDTFSLDPTTREIITPQLEDGFICIAYNSEILDEDGDYLIPENSKLIEALAQWALCKHWEERAMAHEQGASQIWMHLETKAALLLKEAKGSLILGGINPQEVAQISFNQKYVSLALKVPEYFQSNKYI